jgi:predicted metal-dependent HD superfamily phosphohydrolase
MEYQEISKKTHEYIDNFYEKLNGRKLPYHNKTHTENVVAATIKIADHYHLNNHNLFVVTMAAWFHDIGYYLEDGTDHEVKGAAAAAITLEEFNVDDTTILEVKKCILATRIPQQPNELNEQIICDADLFHLGTDAFFDTDKLMRKEYVLMTGIEISKNEWRRKSIEFLRAHHFHTEYCKALLDVKKQENLQQLIDKIKEKDPLPDAEKAAANKAVLLEHKEALKEKKTEKPARGIETMFRIASTNHQRLSDMADRKSHIMISVNSIIISVVIGLVVRKLETAHNLIVPTMILLGGSVIAVIFSVLATRPKIPGGDFSSEQLANRSVNLLFFGNFYKMDYDHYYQGMKQVMNDADFLYASLIKDIHSQGVVLGQKYKLLRISYTIFMFTLIVSVLAFAASIILFE